MFQLQWAIIRPKKYFGILDFILYANFQPTYDPQYKM